MSRKLYYLTIPGSSIQTNQGLVTPFIMLPEESSSKAVEMAKKYLKNCKGLKAECIEDGRRLQHKTKILEKGEWSDEEIIDSIILRIKTGNSIENNEDIIELLQKLK